MADKLDHPATMLLYLADELSAEDRAAFERVLLSDPAVRGELETLRGIHEEFATSLEKADRSAPLAGETSAVLRIGRAMREHQLRRLAASPVVVTTRQWRRLPAWVYPVSAVAALVLIFIGRWASKPVDMNIKGAVSVASATKPDDVAIEPVIDLAENTTEDNLESNFRNSNPVQGSEIRELAQIEHQAADLSRASADPLAALYSNHYLSPENE